MRIWSGAAASSVLCFTAFSSSTCRDTGGTRSPSGSRSSAGRQAHRVAEADAQQTHVAQGEGQLLGQGHEIALAVQKDVLVDVGEPLRELDGAGRLARNQVGEAVEPVEEEVGIDLALQGQKLGLHPGLLEVGHRQEVALPLLNEVDGFVDVHDEEGDDHDHEGRDLDRVPVDGDTGHAVPGGEHAHAKGRDEQQVDAEDQQDLPPGVVEPVVPAPVEDHREAIALPDQARKEDEPGVARPVAATSAGPTVRKEPVRWGITTPRRGMPTSRIVRVVDEDRCRRGGAALLASRVSAAVAVPLGVGPGKTDMEAWAFAIRMPQRRAGLSGARSSELNADLRPTRDG